MHLLRVGLVALAVFWGGVSRADDDWTKETTAWVQAVESNNEARIRAKLKAGVDINGILRAESGERILHFAAWEGIQPSTVRLLLQLGANPALPDREGLLPLEYAARNGEAHSSEPEKVKVLGPPTKSKEARLRALLSCLHGFETPDLPETVHYFVDELKVDVNQADAAGRTPLMAASRVFFADVVRLLIERGANVNARDARGRTALFYLLTNYQIIISGPDDNESALDFSQEFRETFELLLKSGADGSAVDAEGQTAIIAYVTGEAIGNTAEQALTVVRELKKAGASVSAQDAHHKAALAYLPSLKGQLPKKTLAALRQLLRQK